MTTTDAHNHYRLTKIQQMQTRDGFAFHATLTHKGKAIGAAENSGHGGGTFVRFDNGPTSPEAKAFDAAVNAICPIEMMAVDLFIERLMMVADLDCKRSVLVVFQEDGDPFETGSFRQVSNSAKGDHKKIIATFAKQYAAKKPRFWDKERADFVPADQIV